MVLLCYTGNPCSGEISPKVESWWSLPYIDRAFDWSSLYTDVELAFPTSWNEMYQYVDKVINVDFNLSTVKKGYEDRHAGTFESTC